jgi:hypothetical protein
MRWGRLVFCVLCVASIGLVQGCGSDSKRPGQHAEPDAGAGGSDQEDTRAGAGGDSTGEEPGGASGAAGATTGQEPDGRSGAGGSAGDDVSDSGAAGTSEPNPDGTSGAGGVSDGDPTGSAGVGGVDEPEGAAGAGGAPGEGGAPGIGGSPAVGGSSGVAGASDTDPPGSAGAAGFDSAGVGGGGGAAGADSGASSGQGGAPDGEPWIEPVLSDLEVTGAQVALKPEFSPERLRYSFVPRTTGASPAVIATAAPGLLLRIRDEWVESGESVSLEGLAPGSEFDVSVENARGESRSYNVQYLPSGFPDLRITVSEPLASQDPIYVNLKRGTASGTASYVTKFDNAGVPFHYLVENIDTYDFKKHSGGQLSYARGRQNTEHVVLDGDFNELARVKTVGLVNTDVHDFHLLPNGNQILMAYEPTERDLTPYGGTGSLLVQDAVLQELSPSGEVLFQWNSWGVLPYDQSLYPSAADYAHVNSLELANDGNWLVSVRGFSQVVKIDRASGNITWRLGGIANEFVFVDDPFNGFCGQHTVSQLENGNFLIFDNGDYCFPENPERGRVTRVVEYELDELLKTAKLVWSFQRPSTVSAAQGSAQRLPNGNTFIGWGSNTNVLATEVNPSGATVFEVQATSNRGGFVSYRARRFAD